MYCSVVRTEETLEWNISTLTLILFSKFQFPWQALLFVEDKNGVPATCGGSLISDKAVLTSGKYFFMPAS